MLFRLRSVHPLFVQKLKRQNKYLQPSFQHQVLPDSTVLLLFIGSHLYASKLTVWPMEVPMLKWLQQCEETRRLALNVNKHDISLWTTLLAKIWRIWSSGYLYLVCHCRKIKRNFVTDRSQSWNEYCSCSLRSSSYMHWPKTEVTGKCGLTTVIFCDKSRTGLMLSWKVLL